MPEVLPSMSGWWNQRSLFTRLLVYAVAATLTLVTAAGVGAVVALVVGGNLSWPAGERARLEEPSPAREQGESPPRQQADSDHPQDEDQQQYTDRSQLEKADAKRGQAASQDIQVQYVDGVGEIQANAVEVFLDSHGKLLRYDSLTSGDIEKMQANEAALQGFAGQASDLKAPQKYREQKVVFLSAIDELHQGAQLAYALAADPISATQSDFDDYDRLIDEAAAGLQQSNEILGNDYKTIEGIRSVNTS
jgi:hypothetical protein